jgi:glycosyltransferase involved in cell wall biosynthesis
MHTIGIDFEKLKYPHNGLYTFCVQLGQRLLNMTKEDEELLYYLPKDFDLFQGDFTKLTYKWYDRYFFNAPKLDLWHAVHQSGNVWPVGKAKQTILTIHDLNFLYDDRKSESSRKQLLKELQQQMDEADCIVSISHFTHGDINKHLRLAPEKSRIIYQGSELQMFPSFDSPAYRPASPFLFTIGMLTPKKNFHVLPALLQHNDYELIIAGKTQGGYIDKIKSEAASFGVSDRVKLVGAISDEEKYWYYKNCSAFVFPSLAEGFGVPPIDAMQFGKPVFLSDKTSLPEIGGDTSYYFRSFEPDDMRQVFEKGMQHYEQHKPAEAIIQRAKSFSWDTNAKEYLKLYRELLGQALN